MVKTTFEIKGKVNTAFCCARIVEDEAIEQIRNMCDYALTEGSRKYWSSTESEEKNAEQAKTGETRQ